MLKKLIFIGFLAGVFGLAVVNAQSVAPTSNTQSYNLSLEGDGTNNGTQASVTQTLSVQVPKATALHLTAGSLDFNIADIANNGGKAAGENTWYCVSGPASDASKYGTLDTTTGDFTAVLGSNFYGQTQVLPMGTYYDLTASSWPNVTIVGNQHITQYPPIALSSGSTSGGTLVPGSKQYFVCYRTFVLQTFSNFSNYQLNVTRTDPTTTGTTAYPEPVYIQGNTYCSAAGGSGYEHATGLFALDSGSPTASLLPVNVGVGPTGQMAEACGQPGYKSWLDDLVVVAVKIDGEHYGTSSTQLTYTLVSADSAFSSF